MNLIFFIVYLPETLCLRITSQTETPIELSWTGGGFYSFGRRREFFVLQLRLRSCWLTTA